MFARLTRRVTFPLRVDFSRFVHLKRNALMKFLSLFLFSFLFTSNFQAQDSLVVCVNVTDDERGEPIQNVTIQINGLIQGEQAIFRTYMNGVSCFTAPVPATLILYFSHPLFNPASATKKLTKSADTLQISVEMNPIRDQLIDEVVVKAPGVPDTVFESARLSVADFEVLKDGRMVLLTYPKNLKQGSELLLYDGLSILNSFRVPGRAEELTRDYRGNAHVVCQDNVFGLMVSEKQVGVASLEKAYFLKYVAPIVDTVHSKMFFSNYSDVYPAFTYFTFDQYDSTYSKIIDVQDDLMMELYRSEYKWADVRTKLWAKEQEHATGIDAEVWVGANYFTQSLYYKEVYAPLFYRNDSVFVFDYYKDLLFHFDAQGNRLDSVAIYHHYQPKSTGWQRQLIQDRVTGQVYALYDRAGYTYLGLVDLTNGQITEKVKLEFRYIDKVQVYNNYVYYVYRPFESVQKRFLYKERLPYDFGTSRVLEGDAPTIED